MAPTEQSVKKNEEEEEEEQDVEILKAAAQAWHGHSGNPRPTREFDAHRRRHSSRPTRFRQEAMKGRSGRGGPSWDFGQSLWDSYEIVTLCRRLEAGLALHQPIEEAVDELRKRRRESKNSLRSLFNRIASRRFQAPFPKVEDEDNLQS